jgi:hypothetical protein
MAKPRRFWLTSAFVLLGCELSASRYRIEIRAVKEISTLHVAESQFQSLHGRYAMSLAELGPGGADLIDKDLASGTKGGYYFTLESTPDGFYSIRASPVKAGNYPHTYLSDHSLNIHQHRGQEPATTHDPVLGPG